METITQLKEKKSIKRDYTDILVSLSRGETTSLIYS